MYFQKATRKPMSGLEKDLLITNALWYEAYLNPILSKQKKKKISLSKKIVVYLKRKD
jgi:hypothetical protein